MTKTCKQLNKTVKECQHKWNLFTLKYIFSCPKISVSNKLGMFVIDINENLQMQSLEFTKSLYFGSN